MPSIEHGVPRLAAHARLRNDPLTGALLLLYPEGVIELDQTAAAIVQRCDGKRSIGAIAGELAEAFEGDAGEITRDVSECLQDLRDRGLIRLDP